MYNLLAELRTADLKFRLAVPSTAAVHKKAFAVSRSGGSSSADIFSDRGRDYSDADIHTFCCKKNIEFFNYGVSTRTGGRGLSQCWHFLDKRGLMYHDFVQTSLRIAPEQKTTKLSIGYRPTNSYSLPWLLWLLNLMAVLGLRVLLGMIYCMAYIFFQSPLI